MNAPANIAYADKMGIDKTLTMPVLFLHAAYDYTCQTLDSPLAEPMRDNCTCLTEVTVESGHWMAQEKPSQVNAALDYARRDVIPLNENNEVQVFMRFRDMKGRYVMHCHNVVHEDHAMMIRFDLT